MSLALAEVLFKQDGNSSLDMARKKHNNHGLNLVPITKLPNSFADAAQKLVSKPVGGENRFGTFELWHRTARWHPFIGLKNFNTPKKHIVNHME